MSVNFDNYSEKYHEIHNANIKVSGVNTEYFSEHKIKEVKKWEQDYLGKKILDVGCGIGNSIVFFQRYFPLSEVHGIDISGKSIDAARKKTNNTAKVSVYDGVKIPYADNFFDIVFMANVLHHVNKDMHADLISEIYRVTGRNKKIYIFEHNPWNPITRRIVDKCIFDKDAVLLSPIYCRQLFNKANLNNIEQRFVIFFPRYFAFLEFIEHFLWKFPIGAQYYVKGTK